MEIAIVASLVVIGYFTGRHFEKKHYQSLNEREKKLNHIAVITSKWENTFSVDEEGRFLGGGVVIGSDYFKTFVAGLRSLVGGRMSSFESLLDRGRREAICRMKEEAALWGATRIINVRVETATIDGKSGGGLPCMELFAYGTAIREKKTSLNK